MPARRWPAGVGAGCPGIAVLLRRLSLLATREGRQEQAGDVLTSPPYGWDTIRMLVSPVCRGVRAGRRGRLSGRGNRRVPSGRAFERAAAFCRRALPERIRALKDASKAAAVATPGDGNGLVRPISGPTLSAALTADLQTERGLASSRRRGRVPPFTVSTTRNGAPKPTTGDDARCTTLGAGGSPPEGRLLCREATRTSSKHRPRCRQTHRSRIGCLPRRSRYGPARRAEWPRVV